MLKLPIDHVVIPVADLEAAGAAFEAAGFLVTPETRHSASMGTANRCIMFDTTYIELMGIVAETPANLPWRRGIENGSGIGGLALRTDDIDEAGERLAARNIRTEATRHFSRRTDDGELRFSVIRIDPSETPGLQCLVCQHHTRELLWKPELLQHPNGVVSMEAISFPRADVVHRLAEKSGVNIVAGESRLTLRGTTAFSRDLTAACGTTIEVLSP